MEAYKNGLSLADYLVFGASLMVCTTIGIYHACAKSKTDTIGEFLLGGRELKVLPLTISLAVSVVSAVTLLGLPAEMYTQGSQYFFNIGSGLGMILTALIFVPLLHPLRLTSMFEYLERRFASRAVRLTGSVMEIIALLLYGGTALYAPATAIAGVSPLPVWSLAIVLGCFVTFYTALGGLKGVIWTDVFQSVIMVTAILVVIIQGCIAVGGIGEVFRINSEGDRLHFYNFDPDPRTRHTFWGLTAGFAFGGLSFYGASQFTFQRFSATKKLRDAKITVLLNLPLFYTFHILLCFAGLIIYAYYAKVHCDPLQSKQIQSSNQLLPLFVLHTLGSVPGSVGLFLAALTSGALSTISSVINSVAALVWEDFIRYKMTAATDFKAVFVNKVIVAVSGAIIISLTFLADNFGPHIFQVCFALLGASGGPQLGMFLLGALVPWANGKGAMCGCLAGLAMTLWVTVGAYITKPFTLPLPPVSTDQCYLEAYNTTSIVTDVFTEETSYHEVMETTLVPNTFTDRELDFEASSDRGITELYRLSYTWYTALGVCVCMIVGIVVSLSTGGCHPDENLILPWYSVFKKCRRSQPSWEISRSIDPKCEEISAKSEQRESMLRSKLQESRL